MSYIIRNCFTIKPFHFTKTQKFPFKVEIFCFEENMGLYKLSEWFKYNTKNIKQLHH